METPIPLEFVEDNKSDISSEPEMIDDPIFGMCEASKIQEIESRLDPKNFGKLLSKEEVERISKKLSDILKE